MLPYSAYCKLHRVLLLLLIAISIFVTIDYLISTTSELRQVTETLPLDLSAALGVPMLSTLDAMKISVQTNSRTDAMFENRVLSIEFPGSDNSHKWIPSQNQGKHIGLVLSALSQLLIMFSSRNFLTFM